MLFRLPSWGIARFCLACVFIVVSLGLLHAQDRPPLTDSRPVKISARPFSLDPRGERRSFGKLTWICGLVLSSSTPQFGGFSGLAISSDGSHLTSISDEGSWLTAEITYENGCMKGLTNARMGPLLDTNGKPLISKKNADAEGFATETAGEMTGTAYVSFERRHRIAKYQMQDGAVTGKAQLIPLPPDVRKLNSNSGLEALAVLQGGPLKGSLLAIAESPPRSAGENAPSPAWLIIGSKTEKLFMILHDGYEITDLAPLPDGSVLVLERRFKGILDGVHMRIRSIAADAIKPGARLDGQTLIELGGYSYEVDNMEGLAVHLRKNGDRILTVISDDNFSPLQRTLLMQFKLPK